MDNLKIKDGMVQTGENTYVNPQFMSQEGLAQARQFAGITVPTTISATSLNTQPVSVPPPQVSATAEGISGQAGAIAEQAKAQSAIERETEQKQMEAQQKATTSKSKLEGLYESIKATMGLRPSIEKEQKITEKAQKATDVTNKIEASQRSQQNEIKAIEQTGILTDVQKAAKIREINRQYAFEQADLALIQSAANRDLTTAQSIADRKMQLMLEPLQFEMEYTKMFYDENRESMTKAEERAFQAKMEADKRRYEETKSLQTNINKLQLEAATMNAPIEVIRAIGQAKTYDEAVRAAGSYAGGLVSFKTRLEIQKLQKEIATKTLPTTIASKVQTIASQFGNETAVKSYQVSAEAIDAVQNAGTSPTDDIQRIYAFAKVMDPNSVVREGEYKTVQDYSTALLQRTGLKAKRVFTNSGFLTQEARNFLLETLQNRLKSSEKSYDNIYSEYINRINKSTGSVDGAEYLIDYKKPFEELTNQKTNDPLDLGIGSNPLGI